MAKGAYAQTGQISPDSGPTTTTPPAVDPGPYDAGSGATTAAPMTWLDVLAVLLGSSPMDVILGNTSTDVSGLSALLGDPKSQTYYGPTGGTVGMAVRNNLYQAPGMVQQVVARHTGVIVQPGADPNADRYIIDDSNLPPDVKRRAKDMQAMSKDGFVAYVKPGQPGQPGRLKWIYRGAQDTQAESLAKQGFVVQHDNRPYQDKLVTGADVAGKGVIGSITTTATPVQLLTALYALPADQLIQLQHKMWNAGLFQGTSRPVWGVVDDSTRDAYVAAMKNGLAHPDQTLDESMASLGTTSMATRHAARQAKKAEAEAKAAGTETVSVMSDDSVAELVNRVSEELLGFRLGPDETKRLTGVIQGRQTADAQQAHDIAKANAAKESGLVSDADLDRFVNLFVVPHADRFPGTVGHLGIRPRDWPRILAQLSMDPTTPFTPDNERTVMKELAADYYDQFGNWYDVAAAILGGEGAGWADISSGLAPAQTVSTPGHGSSITNKAGEISAAYNRGQGMLAAADANAAMAGGAGGVVPIQQFVPEDFVNQEMQRAHPREYFANSFVDRANDFLGMLGPTVPGAGQPL